jgi:hypothetical protein
MRTHRVMVSAWIGPAVRQSLELVFPRGAKTVSKR